LALPIVLHGCETWAISEQDRSRTKSVEIKFMRPTAKYTGQTNISKQTKIFYQNLKSTQP